MSSPSRVTTPQIKAMIERLKLYYRSPEMNESLFQAQEDTAQEELKLLSQHRVCPIPRGPKLLGLSYPELKEQTISHFDNANSLLALACVTDMLFFPSSLLSVERKVHELITQVRKIGEESIAGIAMSGNLKNASNLLVLKSPRDPNDLSLLHELFVGVFCTNQLRRLIPNFSYVYGGFSCSAPILETKASNQVVTWCRQTVNPVQYVLYENIVPSISMQKFNETCTPEQFLNQYLQVLYSLRTAAQHCEFTHYDLHDGNVLIREMPEASFSIPYETEQGVREYLLTDRVATIIDYGFTFIRHNGKPFGHWLRIPYGVFPESSFPLHAAYKLLMFSLLHMARAGNINAYTLGNVIFRFFNTTESLEDALRDQLPTYYSLLPTRAIQESSLDDFLRYIRQNLPTPFLRTSPGPERVLGCQEGDVCLSLDQILDEVREKTPGIEITGYPPGPRDLFEMVDLISLGYETNDSQVIREAIQNFQPFYPQAIQDGKLEVQELKKEMLDQLNNLQVIYLFPPGINLTEQGFTTTGAVTRGPTGPFTGQAQPYLGNVQPRLMTSQEVRLLLSGATLNLYRQFVINFFQLLGTTGRYTTNLRMLLIVATLYQDTQTLDFVRGEIESFRGTRESIEQIRQILVRDVQFVNLLWKEPEFTDFRSGPESSWLRESFPTYIPFLIKPIPEVEITGPGSPIPQIAQ